MIELGRLNTGVPVLTVNNKRYMFSTNNEFYPSHAITSTSKSQSWDGMALELLNTILADDPDNKDIYNEEYFDVFEYFLKNARGQGKRRLTGDWRGLLQRFTVESTNEILDTPILITDTFVARDINSVGSLQCFYHNIDQSIQDGAIEFAARKIRANITRRDILEWRHNA